MMKNTKRIRFWFTMIAVAGIYIPVMHAQDLNIKGDTVYVNAEAEYVIYFPTTPRKYSTLPGDAPYELNPVVNGVAISAKGENTPAATLKVSEADRNHVFTIVFKKDIDLNNNALLIYDYKTVKKLEQHVRAMAGRNAGENKSVIETPAAPDNSAMFNALMEKGDRDFKALRYQEAQGSFNEAHTLRPADPVPLQRIEDIKRKLAESDRSAQQDKDRKYLSLTTDAKVFFDQKKYEQARDAYQQALALRPGNAYDTRQLETIEKILLQQKTQKENQESSDTYRKLMVQGDKALDNNDLTEARSAYEQALLIRPNDVSATSRLKSVERKEKEKGQKEELTMKYTAAMEAGSRFSEAGDYASAKIEYNKAMSLIPGPKPQEQIKKVNDQIARQAAQLNAEKRRQAEEGAIASKYTTLLKKAEMEFEQSNYIQAKKIYGEAAALKPEEEYPKERLLTIDNIIARIESDTKARNDSVSQANAAKQQMARQAEVTGRYTTLIENAGREFDRSNYAKAKSLYAEASKLKPSEDYPRERLLTIDNITTRLESERKAKNDSLALAKEVNKKYTLAMSSGHDSYRKNDLFTARTYYEEATNLKPSEEEPRNLLGIINDKLATKAKEIEVNNNYNSKILLADSQRIANKPEAAIITYNEALQLKPLEPYPKYQINYIQTQRNRDAIKKGDKATADKRWYDAITAYNEALSIQPKNEYAQKGLKIAIYQADIARADSLSRVVVPKEPEPPAKTKKAKRKKQAEQDDASKAVVEETKQTPQDLAAQKTPVPYSDEELKTKYPEFDFSVLPPEQPFNQTAVYTKDKESLEIYRAMVRQQPRLDLNYSDQKIKIICEGINFRDSTVYFKMRIQNYSASDFLTGAMMLTWTKAAGNRVKLYPNHLYPSPLPIVRPGHEAYVIYACKTYTISNDESLSFEMLDRPKKISLQVKIPGPVFNKELARQD